MSFMTVTEEMVTTNGEEFETTYSDAEAADKVLANRTRLDSFFVDLAEKQQNPKISLSEKQRPYLHKGALKAEGEWSDFAPGDGPALEGLGSIVDHFDRAHEKGLEYPTIRFETLMEDYGGLKLARATQKSSRPGSVSVTDISGSQFWGRIRRDGTFHDRDGTPRGLTDVLEEIAENPAEIAAEEGHETGKCCFCGYKLTEEGSVSVGYGPICAQNFGLPHPQN